jgi:hypothetical protein
MRDGEDGAEQPQRPWLQGQQRYPQWGHRPATAATAGGGHHVTEDGRPTALDAAPAAALPTRASADGGAAVTRSTDSVAVGGGGGEDVAAVYIAIGRDIDRCAGLAKGGRKGSQPRCSRHHSPTAATTTVRSRPSTSAATAAAAATTAARERGIGGIDPEAESDRVDGDPRTQPGEDRHAPHYWLTVRRDRCRGGGGGAAGGDASVGGGGTLKCSERELRESGGPHDTEQRSMDI